MIMQFKFNNIRQLQTRLSCHLFCLVYPVCSVIAFKSTSNFQQLGYGYVTGFHQCFDINDVDCIPVSELFLQRVIIEPVETRMGNVKKYERDQTIQAGHIAEVHDVPIQVLIRPIPSVLDEEKVGSLMNTISVSERVGPM